LKRGTRHVDLYAMSQTTHTDHKRYEVEWFDPYDGERCCRHFSYEADALAYWRDLAATWLPNMRQLRASSIRGTMSR